MKDIITGEFLSTPSARRATPEGRLTGDASAFLSTPSARRATKKAGGRVDQSRISIHALREEGDISRSGNELHPTQFLSTPSARRATKAKDSGNTILQFLSTPSARRATFDDW